MGTPSPATRLFQFAVRFDATGPSAITTYTDYFGRTAPYHQRLGNQSYVAGKACCSRLRPHKHRLELFVVASERKEAVTLGYKAVAEAFPGSAKLIEVVDRKTIELTGDGLSRRHGVAYLGEISR